MSKGHAFFLGHQITNVMRPLDGEGATQVLLMGHRRLRITSMVSCTPSRAFQMTIFRELTLIFPRYCYSHYIDGVLHLPVA